MFVEGSRMQGVEWKKINYLILEHGLNKESDLIAQRRDFEITQIVLFLVSRHHWKATCSSLAFSCLSSFLCVWSAATPPVEARFSLQLLSHKDECWLWAGLGSDQEHACELEGALTFANPIYRDGKLGPLFPVLGIQIIAWHSFNPSGFNGTWKGNPSYLFIRLLFILMVHRVIARVNSWTVSMNEKMISGITSRNMRERKEFASITFQNFGCFLSSLVMFQGLQFLGEFFLIRKPLESPGITSKEGPLRDSGWFPAGFSPLGPEMLLQTSQLCIGGD